MGILGTTESMCFALCLKAQGWGKYEEWEWFFPFHSANQPMAKGMLFETWEEVDHYSGEEWKRWLS